MLRTGWILAYGAALTSLGVALATWNPRVGRVLVAAVTVHPLITVGWLIPVLVLSDHDRDGGRGLAAASSYFGPGQLTMIINEQSKEWGFPWDDGAGWAAGWIVFDSVVAYGLFHATLATFERCLGRVSEGVGRHNRDAKTEVKNEHVSTRSRHP